MTITAQPPTTIDPAFRIGQRVYHGLADTCTPGLVTGIVIRPGQLTYFVAWADHSETSHFDFELTTEYTPDFEQT